MTTIENIVTLEDVTSRIGDGLHGTPNYDENGDYYFINGNNLSNGKIVIKSDTKRISREEYNKIKKDLSSRTILLAINGTIGNLAFYNGEKIALGKSACYLNVKEDIEIKYIRYLLEHDDFQKYAIAFATGATIKNLGLKAVRDYKFILPPLPTQRKIASILSAYDDLIENNLKRIKLLEEIAQRTYEEWFVKFCINGEQLPIDEKTGLPLGWSFIEFQDIGQIVTGKTPSTTNQSFYSGDIPFVKTPDMSDHPYVLTTNQYLSELGANTQKNKFISKNSLMISCIGTVGVVALASQLCQTNQQINTIVFKEPVFTYYVYCFAKGIKPLLEALGSNGATMANVNKGKFEKIIIAYPHLKLIEEFHSLCKPLFDLILNLQKQNQELKESRDILLPKLMNGTIKVSES